MSPSLCPHQSPLQCFTALRLSIWVSVAISSPLCPQYCFYKVVSPSLCPITVHPLLVSCNYITFTVPITAEASLGPHQSLHRPFPSHSVSISVPINVFPLLTQYILITVPLTATVIVSSTLHLPHCFSINSPPSLCPSHCDSTVVGPLLNLKIFVATLYSTVLPLLLVIDFHFSISIF